MIDVFFSIFKRKWCLEIHKLKEWVKFYLRVNNKLALNNQGTGPCYVDDQYNYKYLFILYKIYELIFFEIYLNGIPQEELALVMQTLEGHKPHTQKSQNL